MAGVRLRCAAVLFDLDGVLVDSRVVVARTWQRWLVRHDLRIPDLVRRAHGRRSIDTVREIAPLLRAEEEVEWLAAAELDDTDGLCLLPGARGALHALGDDRRAVVTSGGRPLAELRLRHVGLPIPRVLVTAEDVEAGKPAPDGYRRAAERLGHDPADCVVIEDTPAGISAGRAAGATVLAVATTFPPGILGDAHAVLTSLAAVRITLVGSDVHLMIESR
jgi:sugar-phosphatase